MANIVLICPEPIREKIQGIGIRFLEMANHLSIYHNVTLWAPNYDFPQWPDLKIIAFPEGDFAKIILQTNIVIIHGHISKQYFSQLKTTGLFPGPSLIVDLYDPFLIENLQYTHELGEWVFYRDRQLLYEQLEVGDFFMTSSEAQRMFYIGILTGIGRLVPNLYHQDKTLRNLIDIVPFGITPIAQQQLDSLEHGLKGRVTGLAKGDIVVFFGGVYNWYDPMLLMQVCDEVFEKFQNVKVIFSINPNQETTPQATFKKVIEYAKNKGWIDQNIFFIPWYPYEKRFSYLKDVDIAICLHEPSLETDLSLRTRILDYMNVGIPIISTDGGESSRILKEAKSAVLVQPADANDLYSALIRLLAFHKERRKLGINGQQWVQLNMNWQKTLEPLIKFCNNPHLNTKSLYPEKTNTNSTPSLKRIYQYWKTNSTRLFMKKILSKFAQTL